MTDGRLPADEPIYVISVAAKLVQLHPQTLRYYDRIGLLTPSRTRGRIRLYSQRDVERLRKIVRLTEDLGVNLAGVEVVLNMSHHIEQLTRENEGIRREATAEIESLRRRLRQVERKSVAAQGHQIINVPAREITNDSKEEQQ